MNTLRRMLALALATLALLPGCVRSDLTGNVNEAIAGWRPDQNTQDDAAPEPSTIHTLDSPAFGSFIGFDVRAWPDDNQLRAEHFLAVDGWFGQIEYRMADDRLLVLRVARAGGKRVGSTYGESHDKNVSEFDVGDIPVREGYGEDGCVTYSWQRGDFQYIVHSTRQQQAPPREVVETLVSGLDCTDSE